MMSVPAINTLPPSGSQPPKISSGTTANPSVSPISIAVPPKLSVIPPSQISPSKPQIGVNLSSVPLSLVYENKVVASQAQSTITTNKPPSDKPKDLSPAKPTSNGVDTTGTKSPSAQTIQTLPSPSVSSNKTEEPSHESSASNHSDKKFTSPSNEPPVSKDDEGTSNPTPQQLNMTTESVEQTTTQNNAVSEGCIETKCNSDLKPPTTDENSVIEAKAENSDVKCIASLPSKRKREQKPVEKKEEPEPEKKPRRIRSQVLPYQSPLPELATFITKSLKEKEATQKSNEEKLIVFYKNEFLAVRNAEGGFYLCQTLQNVFRTSHRIRIRWLSQEKEKSTEDGDMYTPDFYDLTDFECILTTVALSKMDKNMYKLPKIELERIKNILKRALDVEKGVTEKLSITEEHPDGIDLSLYKDESQLQKPKKSGKGAHSSAGKRNTKQVKQDDSGEVDKTPKKMKASNRGKLMKKTVADKNKNKKPNGGKSGSKATDQLKVSPPNEKARVVAKVLRKVDFAPVKGTSNKKQTKSKQAKKRYQDLGKKQNKKTALKGGKKVNIKHGGKDETHHDRRQGKIKHGNKKN